MSTPTQDQRVRIMSETLEEVARERYSHLIEQTHGLFRATMAVMKDDINRKEWLRRARLRLEEAGYVPKSKEEIGCDVVTLPQAKKTLFIFDEAEDFPDGLWEKGISLGEGENR